MIHFLNGRLDEMLRCYCVSPFLYLSHHSRFCNRFFWLKERNCQTLADQIVFACQRTKTITTYFAMIFPLAVSGFQQYQSTGKAAAIAQGNLAVIERQGQRLCRCKTAWITCRQSQFKNYANRRQLIGRFRGKYRQFRLNEAIANS